MKPDEPIHTGMIVWHESGETSHVVSVLVVIGEISAETPVPLPKIEVRLAPTHSPAFVTAVPQDTFMKEFHRRLTGWERIEKLEFTAPEYEGALRGHHIIKLGIGSGKEFRIPERMRTPKGRIQEARAEVIDNHDSGTRCESFERFVPTGWQRVLEPML